MIIERMSSIIFNNYTEMVEKKEGVANLI